MWKDIQDQMFDKRAAGCTVNQCVCALAPSLTDTLKCTRLLSLCTYLFSTLKDKAWYFIVEDSTKPNGFKCSMSSHVETK